jgi:hypothetical protein
MIHSKALDAWPAARALMGDPARPLQPWSQRDALGASGRTGSVRNDKASPGVSISDSGPPSSDVFHPLSAASVTRPGAGAVSLEPRKLCRPARGIAIAIIQMLGIQGPSLRQGAAGTTYFEPGGVSFRD